MIMNINQFRLKWHICLKISKITNNKQKPRINN